MQLQFQKLQNDPDRMAAIQNFFQRQRNVSIPSCTFMVRKIDIGEVTADVRPDGSMWIFFSKTPQVNLEVTILSRKSDIELWELKYSIKKRIKEILLSYFNFTIHGSIRCKVKNFKISQA